MILVNDIGGRAKGMNPSLILMLVVRMILGLEGVQRGLRRGAGNAITKMMSRGLLAKGFRRVDMMFVLEEVDVLEEKII